MNVDSFLTHYQVEQNPYSAEEARLDPVFERIKQAPFAHPDFPKILGKIDTPSTSVVFGEKGTGKTAIRISLADRIEAHNRQHPDQKVLLIPYDDLNPVFDHLLRVRKQDAEALFKQIRLADHQDAILASGVTRLVDGLLGQQSQSHEPVTLPSQWSLAVKRIPRQTRYDLAALAALYDQPRSGDPITRMRQVMKRLKLRRPIALKKWRNASLIMLLTFIVTYVLKRWVIAEDNWQWSFTAGMLAVGATGLAGLGYWLWRHASLWRLARKIVRETPAVQRSAGELRVMLAQLKSAELSRQPWPTPPTETQPDTDSRYQLTRRLLEAIGPLGYEGITVLVDRVDEPTLIAGNADRMRQAVWPMFDAKFLQQNGVGMKLLLPIELRYELRKESADFFREARLDKGNLIDRLSWTGTMLYDLCNARINACRPDDAAPLVLTDLFDESITRATLIDALDQMHQPRDAFKFLYAVIQEHCKNVTEEDGQYQIDRATLETVRRSQSDRVQDLYRGQTPA